MAWRVAVLAAAAWTLLSACAQTDERPPMFLSINEGGHVLADDAPVTREELLTRLREAARNGDRVYVQSARGEPPPSHADIREFLELLQSVEGLKVGILAEARQ